MATPKSPTVTVRVYLSGILIGEEVIKGPLSSNPRKEGKGR